MLDRLQNFFAFICSKINIKTVFACIIFTGVFFYYVIPETYAESAGIFTLSDNIIFLINLLGYFLTIVLFLFVLPYIFNKKFTLKISLPVLLICIYMLWALLSIINSGKYINVGIGYFLHNTLPNLGVFAAMLYTLKNKDHKFIINCIVIIIGLNVVISFYQIFFIGGDRSGLFLDPNKYGRLLVVVSNLSILYFFITKSLSKRLIFFLLLALICLNILLLASRGTYILYVFMTAIIIWHTKNKKIIILGALSVIIVGTFFGYMTLQRITANKMDVRNDSDIGRIATNFTGLNMWKAHPIMGIGYGTSAEQYKNYQNKNIPEFTQLVHIHNIYINQLAETGIVGFLLFCAFNGVIIFRLIKKHRKDGGIYKNPYSLFYILAISVYLMHGLIYHTFESEGFYWFILAAALLYLRDDGIKEICGLKNLA